MAIAAKKEIVIMFALLMASWLVFGGLFMPADWFSNDLTAGGIELARIVMATGGLVIFTRN